jgi:hypothetical protein
MDGSEHGKAFKEDWSRMNANVKYSVPYLRDLSLPRSGHIAKNIFVMGDM